MKDRAIAVNLNTNRRQIQCHYQSEDFPGQEHLKRERIRYTNPISFRCALNVNNPSYRTRFVPYAVITKEDRPWK